MKIVNSVAVGVSAAFLLQACAATPMGPTVRVMPPQGKPFEQFQADDSACRGFASSQVSGQADAANNKAVGAAVLGAALGAGIGAAAGGGRGAGIGAASGGAFGTMVGTDASAHEQHSIQWQYNTAYSQCMASKGNQVEQPVVVHPVTVVQPGVVYAPPPAVVYTQPPQYYVAPPNAVPAPAPQSYAPPPGAVPAPPPPPAGQ
jgi:uncharacterized protein YcfJ